MLHLRWTPQSRKRSCPLGPRQVLKRGGLVGTRDARCEYERMTCDARNHGRRRLSTAVYLSIHAHALAAAGDLLESLAQLPLVLKTSLAKKKLASSGTISLSCNFVRSAPRDLLISHRACP